MSFIACILALLVKGIIISKNIGIIYNVVSEHFFLSLDLVLMPKTLLPTVAGCTVGLFPSNFNSGALLILLLNAILMCVIPVVFSTILQ